MCQALDETKADGVGYQEKNHRDRWSGGVDYDR
jgi:hypothetical protein